MPTLTIGSLPLDGTLSRMQEILAEMDARVESADAAAKRATDAAASAASSITQLQTAAEDLLAANTPIKMEFAPTLALATPGTSAVTYTEQFGWAYNLGNLVTLHMSIGATLTKGTGTGRLRINFDALPWLPAGHTGAGFVRSKPGQITLPAGTVGLVPQVSEGSKRIELATYTLSAGTATYISDTAVADATPMTIQLLAWYRTAS